MAKQESQFDPNLLDELIKDCKSSEDILGVSGLIKKLTKALLERALEGELTDHLGYKKYDPSGNNSGNSRNGHSTKTLKGANGELPISIPRDRKGEFIPPIIPKNQTRFNGFDEKILAMYARGISVCDIQAQLLELYGVGVSEGLISNETNEVMEEVKSWQNLSIDRVYPIGCLGNQGERG